jgi:ribosomal protein S18 acetylase RimI-like enzyme
VIRVADVLDAPEVSRLFFCQYGRLPWTDQPNPKPTGCRVRGEVGRLSGAYLYVVTEERFFVTDLWVDNGFRGYRAAVELSHDAENLAKQMGKRIMFGVPIENQAYIKALEANGYSPTHVVYDKEVK